MNITPHLFLTPPIEVYTAINVRRNLVTTKLANFHNKSPPSPPTIVMEGGVETMYNQINFTFNKG